MVLVSYACVNDTEPLSVLNMDSILLLILSLSSCSFLYLRDDTSLINFSAFACVSLEVGSCSCGMIIFSDTILSTNFDVRAVK